MSTVKINKLTCEYKKNPLGIDIVSPRLSWIIETDRRKWLQSAYRVLVASSAENLNNNNGDLWDSGKVASDKTSQIVYQGASLKSEMQCFWKVCVWDEQANQSDYSESALWTMGLLQKQDFKADWIGYDKWQQDEKDEESIQVRPASYLRKEFDTAKKITRATVYSSALGLYELLINGQKVGDDYFAPGWTDYNIRVYYNTYDVTDLLDEGANAVGAILAEGWYSGYIGFQKRRQQYGPSPRLYVQLQIEYEDGSKQIICSDDTWKASFGPITEADILMGQTCDARKEMPGWDKTGFNYTDWSSVDVSKKPDFKFESYPGVTVKKMEELKTVEVTQPTPGKYVFDLGQNFSGVVRLKVKGSVGDKIVLKYAEILQEDKNVYTDNLRSAKCTDTYILKDDSAQQWMAQFTYHGFRYVEVSGLKEKPAAETITGIVMYSDTPPAGSFECSNDMVNQLYSNIIWGQKSNFFDVPTDCPQRDERLGWSGDAVIFIRTAAYNMDVAAFFTKWFVDYEDAQRADGAFADVAPAEPYKNYGTAAWGDAGIVCPWIIYQIYGDIRVLEKHYGSMKKWIEYCKINSDNLLRPAEGYGDWVSIDSDTPKDVIGTAFFAYSTSVIIKIAALLGKEKDEKYFVDLFEQLKTAFNEAYVTDDVEIKGDTQTCYLMALDFELLDEDKRARAAERLVARIEAKNWHLSTGFIGLGYLLPVLTQTGYNDIAYRLLLNKTFPSWGYSILHGATTIWERWDGWTAEKGFQDIVMNSFNHYAFGSVGQWMINTAAGIDSEDAGFKRIVICPQPGGDLTYVKAHFDSVNGRVVSDWKKGAGKFTLNVTIPANTSALVYVPDCSDSVTESGKDISDCEDVKLLGSDNGFTIMEVGSGNYRFESKLK